MSAEVINVFAFQDLPVTIAWITRQGEVLRHEAVSYETLDELTHYRVDVIDPETRSVLYSTALPAGTTAEQARDAFQRTAAEVDDRVRLVEIRERPIALASAKV